MSQTLMGLMGIGAAAAVWMTFDDDPEAKEKVRRTLASMGYAPELGNPYAAYETTEQVDFALDDAEYWASLDGSQFYDALDELFECLPEEMKTDDAYERLEIAFIQGKYDSLAFLAEDFWVEEEAEEAVVDQVETIPYSQQKEYTEPNPWNMQRTYPKGGIDEFHGGSKISDKNIIIPKMEWDIFQSRIDALLLDQERDRLRRDTPGPTSGQTGADTHGKPHNQGHNSIHNAPHNEVTMESQLLPQRSCDHADKVKKIVPEIQNVFLKLLPFDPREEVQSFEFESFVEVKNAQPRISMTNHIFVVWGKKAGGNNAGYESARNRYEQFNERLKEFNS